MRSLQTSNSQLHRTVLANAAGRRECQSSQEGVKFSLWPFCKSFQASCIVLVHLQLLLKLTFCFGKNTVGPSFSCYTWSLSNSCIPCGDFYPFHVNFLTSPETCQHTILYSGRANNCRAALEHIIHFSDTGILFSQNRDTVSFFFFSDIFEPAATSTLKF